MRPLDRRLLRRAGAARTLLRVDVALGVGTAVLVLVQGTLIAWVVVRGFQGAPLGAVAGGFVLLALTFVARGALSWLFEVAGRRTASTILSELRLELVTRRLRTQPSALDSTEGGELATAAVAGVDGLGDYFAGYLPQLVLVYIVPVLVLVYVATLDLESAGIMLVTLPLVPVFMWLIGRYTQERTRERWQALQLLSTHFLDVVRGLPTLRAFNRSRPQTATMSEVGESYRAETMATLRVAFLSGSVLELAATLGVALVAVTVGVRLVDGSLGFRAGLTVLILAPELYLPFRQLGAQFHSSADGLAAAARILELLDAEPAVHDTGTRIPPSPAESSVRLENVSFTFPARPGLVLDRFDLELSPGETVALIGESGAGKSTVASLLLRLAEPTAGRVTVGGVDLTECSARAWRELVAWVPQQPTLFRATIADNIRLGDASASLERVRAAARLAGADEFVAELPDGYDTVVGDGGRTVSFGERRRIALARALIREAPLLILDEPTADLDPASAELVADALEELHGRVTILVIAHRLEVLRSADRVLFLEAGRTAEPVPA
jgi:ATP-binding cassette, subfamily C, bacterial CydD